VPACLKEPQERWRGPPPTGSSDPVWQAYQQRRIANREKVIQKLSTLWRLDPAPEDVFFWRDMTINLLDLFPAFEVLPESRGSKRTKLLEPESAARRTRRDRRNAHTA
jgi:hypothetical protein